MEFLEVGGIFLSPWGTKLWIGVECDVWMVTLISEEG